MFDDKRHRPFAPRHQVDLTSVALAIIMAAAFAALIVVFR